MTNNFSIKAQPLNASIKDADMKQGIVTGYFASFNTLDSDNDIIMPGAFAKSIMEMGPMAAKPRIKHLLNHNTSQPLGLLETLKEDGTGLYYESKTGSHALGVDFMKMVDCGLITEHSIGYGVVKKTVTNPDADWQNQITNLTELKLWEGSSLTAWGANMNTPLTGSKHMRMKAADRIPNLIKAIRNGTFTDATFELLEKELLFLQEAIKSDYETTEPELIKCHRCGGATKNIEAGMGYIKCSNCNQAFSSQEEATQPNDEEKDLLNDIAMMNMMFSFAN